MSILSIKELEKKQDERIASMLVNAIKESLETGEYTISDLIPAVQEVLYKIAKKDKVFVDSVLVELRKTYPDIADKISLS